MLMTEDANRKDLLFSAEVPRVTTKNSQHDTVRKEMKCWIKTTTHRCGLLSALMDPLTQLPEKGGSGIHIPFKTLLKSSNYRAEFAALHEAAGLLRAETPPLSYTVFLTDNTFAVQTLQSPKEQLETDTQRLQRHSTARSLSSESLLTEG